MYGTNVLYEHRAQAMLEAGSISQLHAASKLQNRGTAMEVPTAQSVNDNTGRHSIIGWHGHGVPPSQNCDTQEAVHFIN